MLWSHDETNLLKEFLHVSRLGGRWDGPVEEATWENIAHYMNIVGTTRDIALRTYTASNVAWQYISMIWPLLNAENSNTATSSWKWALEEDDLLLHYLSSKYAGGRFEGPIEDGTYDKVAEKMNAIGPMFGFKFRVYTRKSVFARYTRVIYSRVTGHAYGEKQIRWQADETELLLNQASINQGGYLEGDDVAIQQISDIMNQQAEVREWAYRKYTCRVIWNRLERIREDRVATGQLSGPYCMPGDTDPLLVAEESSDPENYAVSDNDMDTMEG